MTAPLPDVDLYRFMRAGHLIRTGHALVAHLECDGAFATFVRECCTPEDER